MAIANRLSINVDKSNNLLFSTGEKGNLIKIASTPLSNIVCHIYNNSFETGIYPTKLKFATVTPAHKADSKMTLNNYRPISVLPIFSKVLERLMHRRLNFFVTKWDFIRTSIWFSTKENY